MGAMLDRILEVKREEVRRLKATASAGDLERLAAQAAPPRDFVGALRRTEGQPIRLIAEFKRASPSAGVIRADLDPALVARRYRAGGASAVSVLTDGPFFSGSLDDLRAVRTAVDLPVLRKDFILDPYQLLESRAVGADAVLLIVAALPDADLAALHGLATELGLAALVEVHTQEELGRAMALEPRAVGINNRDLKTLRVDPETALRLRPLVPPGVAVVAESGICRRTDLVRLEEAGVDAALVGGALMRCDDPGRAVSELLGRQI